MRSKFSQGMSRGHAAAWRGRLVGAVQRQSWRGTAWALHSPSQPFGEGSYVSRGCGDGEQEPPAAPRCLGLH